MVSIIIPVYKIKEEYLRECIESVLNQTYRDIEVILVDDGSPDRCGAICDEYAAVDPRIKVIHKENGGVSSARNRGLDEAMGQYIMFVDADDWIEQDAVKTCLLYQKEYHADLLSFGYYINDESYCANNIKSLSKIECAMKIAGRKRYVMGYLWNKFFLTEIISLNKIRFDETIAICEDSLFCQEYASYCSNVICVTNVLYHYRDNDNSVTRNKFSKKNCTVFDAYKRIIKFCGERYSDYRLNELVYGNYCSHHIQSLRRIKNELTNEERKEFWFIYDFVKENIFKIFRNRYINLKRKLMALYLILTVKK